MNQFFSVKVAFYFGLRMGSGAILTIKFCTALVSAKQIEQLPILMSTKIVTIFASWDMTEVCRNKKETDYSLLFRRS